MEEKIVFLYVPIDNLENAQKIAMSLLNERLCACVNVYPGVRSFYWWEGKIEESPEVVMIVKTRKSLAERTAAKIKELHPYSVPCVAKFSVEILFKPFAEWLFAETQSKISKG